MSDEETYAGVVTDAELVEGSTGNEAIVVTFNIEGKGKLTLTSYMHTKEARAFTIRQMKRLDFDLESRDYDVEACRREIVGRKADCVIEENEYNGKKTLRVKYLEGAGQRKMSPDAIQRLRDRLREPPPEESAEPEGDCPF